MFSHRRKIIGKSLYFVSESKGAYVVKEIYNGIKESKSKYAHDEIEDALRELASISCEQYYTDSSRAIRF